MKIFDASLFKGKPWLPYTPMPVIYEDAFFTVHDRAVRAGREADADCVIDVAYRLPMGLLTCLDIECWDVEPAWSIAQRLNRYQRHARVLQGLRDLAPSTPLCLFGQIPMTSRTRLLADASSVDAQKRLGRLLPWEEAMTTLQALVPFVDAICPNFYLQDQKNLGEQLNSYKYDLLGCRKFFPGLPVYPFLTPRATVSGEWLGGLVWQRLLEMCEQWADGAVLWGGPEPWPEREPWIKTLASFACD